MYDRILVPTDGSDASQGAIDHAIELASQYDATVFALYVVDTAAYSSLEMGSEVVAEALREEGNTAVEAVVDAGEAAGVDVETDVRNGVAHQSILDHADEHDVDLIVMGTHGRTGVGRVLLGSVAEKVVRTATVPVLTVQSDEDESEA
ncbi:universal stress protein [Halobellus clavatus]|jgi:nucleotide-binding universal stress UspA family protein|uniref:Nucleotide-binding universal stress protein, UspA family n=1 Tax=Halobellus clavatus TaxID=660517 RepID=A0A1H3H3X6_9EURY|nr:universal stress protein [Halobellus clavatus]SDY10040.1 Nucleotide-binding universal stress protein, UspA family [Halobellus clavatus]